MRPIIVLVLLGLLGACAPVASGELDRLNQSGNDRLTQTEGRQDFRTFRQQLPAFLLP